MHSNPYAQGGWYNPDNPQTLNPERSENTNAVEPSIQGALPYSYPSTSSQQEQLVFHFTYSTTSILNCGIYGPASRKYLDVTTSIAQQPHVTVFQKYDGNSLATIEWHSKPIVEIPGILSRQYVGQWLRLSNTQSSRIMDVRGLKYIWTPVRDAVHLHQFNSPPTSYLLKIQRQFGTVSLEMSTEAVQAGLLEIAVVATIILQSGRNID